MKNAMNHQRKARPPVLAPRQGKLELVTEERWLRLRDTDRQACRQALALLLHEVVSHPRQAGGGQDER
jgi:hypothetical protein